MRVGDFPIGRGEIYVSRHNVYGPRHFVEVSFLRSYRPATRADILEKT